MPENNSTILIPDISGFTEFMSTTELTHSSHAINMLIDAMLAAVDEDYEVSEIEGDAVLLIKKGPAPSKKEVINTCLKIFNAFHFKRKLMQQLSVCPCGACQAIINLSVKFVAHYGPLAEIRVGRFVKQSGVDMIVAHRLLKNSIGSDEYLLMTEKLLTSADDSSETMELHWNTAWEEYQSIGKIGYQFSLLDDIKKRVPDPEPVQKEYPIDNTSYFESKINVNYLDLYMMLMNIPERASWLNGLRLVQQANTHVFVGSVHHLTFKEFRAVVSPVQMALSDEGIIYAERWRIEELGITVVYEFFFKKEGSNECSLFCRFMNAQEEPLPEDIKVMLQGVLMNIVDGLKLGAQVNS
jgi:hypothetical protein